MMANSVWETDWQIQSDLLVDIATGVSDISESTEPDTCVKYLPPHKLLPNSTLPPADTDNTFSSMRHPPGPIQRPININRTTPQLELSTPRNLIEPTMPPYKKGIVNAELHRATMFYNESSVVAKNNRFSILCNCEGNFFWELIPSVNINFYRGTVPDTVDHCISSVRMYRTFSEAFWDGYNQCITNPTGDMSLFNRDYCLAVYQIHMEKACPRYYTRYTLGSVKSFLMFNESLRTHPLIGVFCQCKTSVPAHTLIASLPYSICFNCLQCTLELKAISPIGVTEHFSYEVNFKINFLAALEQSVRNTSVYFLAQSVFDPAFSITRELPGKVGYLHSWSTGGRHYSDLARYSQHSSYCLLCNHAGNGYTTFLCSTCARKKLITL